MMGGLLDLLEGAGLDVDSLGEDTSGLEEGLRTLFAGSDSGGSDTEALKAQLEKVKQDAEEYYKRMTNQDSAISKKDTRIKELEAMLEAKVPAREFAAREQTDPAAITAMRQAYDAKLNQMAENLQQILDNDAKRQAELKATQAELRHAQVVAELEQSYPVVREFKELVPKTDDKAVLEKWATSLTGFAKSVQDSAYENVRQGYVPASNPPNIGPGKEAEFQREMQLLDKQIESGEIGYSEGQAKLKQLAAMMKPD
jgi:hypothetical protein